MHLKRYCALYLVGLTGFFAPLTAQAQDAPAEENGVILDLEALESLKTKDAGEQAGQETYVVAYAPGAAEPALEAQADIARVAEAARGTMARLTIVAYASLTGHESGNDARRLALRRAIGLRQILVAAGVDGSRVNLRPMGLDAAPESGGDRAEIFVQQP